jgi:hypothetical protein
MPKIIPLDEKLKWLESYENGSSEARIARNTSHHLRIIRNGIDEARRARDIRLANVEILKDALKGHQNTLIEELRSIRKMIEMPRYDYQPTSWHDCIHPESQSEKTMNTLSQRQFNSKKQTLSEETPADFNLLRQHLWNDEIKIWDKLSNWEDTYHEYVTNRHDLQLKIVDILKTRTELPVISEKDDVSPPFVYGYITGDLFFKASIASKLINVGNDLSIDEIIAVPASKDVKYRRRILAEAPGEEEQTKQKLLKALNEIKASTELQRVISSTTSLLQKVNLSATNIDKILLVNYIPGRCDACHRLGL